MFITINEDGMCMMEKLRLVKSLPGNYSILGIFGGVGVVSGNLRHDNERVLHTVILIFLCNIESFIQGNCKCIRLEIAFVFLLNGLL